ncbi:MAG: helix-turn-helix transcriptional regulator [Anaerolineaceae bacterium]|nr:helix-turn-helix transcriptional regulator [Anaerolineaceae bacterium]
MNLKEIRLARGMTQQQLADASGITQSMICRLESREAMPSVETLKALSKVLECSIDELLADPVKEEA